MKILACCRICMARLLTARREWGEGRGSGVYKDELEWRRHKSAELGNMKVLVS